MLVSSLQPGSSVRLNVAVGPASGPPLVLLHGVLRNGRDFSPLLPALLPLWQVHAVDHRGHGLSDRSPEQGYRVVDYAADIATYVRRLAGPAVLYGHSLGALVAVAVAAREPERVAAVVLEDPPAPSFLRALPEQYRVLWAGMRRLAGSPAPLAETTRELSAIRVPLADGRLAALGELRDATSLRFSARCLRDVDPAVFAPLLEDRWLDGYDVERLWAGVRCPLLLLRGDERAGGMLGRREAESLVSLASDGTLIDVAGAGHLLHWQATEATVRLCLGFLQSL